MCLQLLHLKLKRKIKTEYLLNNLSKKKARHEMIWINGKMFNKVVLTEL